MKITHYFQKAEPTLEKENRENAINKAEQEMKMMQNGTKHVEKALLTLNRDSFVKCIAALSRLPERYLDKIPNPFVQYVIKKEIAMRKRNAMMKNIRHEKRQCKLYKTLDVNPLYDDLLDKFLAEKYEDTMLELKDMPELPLVLLPDGGTMDEFEKCLQISQFLSCNQLLLESLYGGSIKVPSAERLHRALYQKKDGFGMCIRSVLLTLTYYLALDGYAKDLTKLRNFAKLVKADVTSDHVFKFVRYLLLRQEPSSRTTKNVPVDADNYFNMNPKLVDALNSLANCSHFSQLIVSTQLEIIQCLIDKVMLQESFTNFITDDVYMTEVINELKELETEMADIKKTLDDVPTSVEEEKCVITRRQSMECSRAEKLRNQRKDQLRRLETAIEQQTNYVKEIKEVNRMRVTPLGTDRFHRVYWFFKDSSNPGVFVEESQESDDKGEENENNVPMRLSKNEFLASLEENVCGRLPPGYNKPVKKWRKIDSPELFETFCDSLCQNGARESILKKRLWDAADNIKKSFSKINLNNSASTPFSS